jgi:REP element-mobilizing transposase RayT
MLQERKSKLPRLSREWYQGRAVVFWTHTIDRRATGWLDDRFHARFREILIHASARYALACPVYVLMPDHWHLVWMGMADVSDQMSATAFLRKHIRTDLAPARLQDRAHDHVLREEERRKNAFMSACRYCLQNPVRAGLVAEPALWPYADAIVSGYPDLNPVCKVFWDDFLKIHQRLAVEG